VRNRGWRGFALPRLLDALDDRGNANSRIRVAFWHLPLFIISERRNMGPGSSRFALELMAWSMVITLIMMHARGSVVAAMLFHASANLCAFTMWEPMRSLLALGPWIVAAVIAGWRIRVRAES